MARSGTPRPDDPDSAEPTDPLLDPLADATLSERMDAWNSPQKPAMPSALLDQIKRARARSHSARSIVHDSAVGTPPSRRRPLARASGRMPTQPALREQLARWFFSQGWQPFAFQHEVWDHAQAGRSGLLHATTGAGKTWAAWGAALLAAAARPAHGLRVLWITPMRALALDTQRALSKPLDALQVDWEVGLRTGDTSAAQRTRQRDLLPDALVTTPESLSLMLSNEDAALRLGGIAAVIVDEWHELLGNKRGVQVQLSLARLRLWNPQMLVCGLSATLGDLDHARQVLVPHDGVLVRGALPKELRIDSLLPHSAERFPWGGHLGLNMLEQVVEELGISGTSLLFTNTRSQAELWYQAILSVRPQWAGLIALHHGSLDAEVRSWVESGLKDGSLRAVVCTSSLDLGVDFLPVERVLQLGSPKGVARLMQRAGRSGHAPGRVSRVTCVPAQSLELLEAAAARRCVQAGLIEPRYSPQAPLDVLIQHLVTIAVGGGFTPQALLAEVRSTWAYRELDDEDWDWALRFIVHGGDALDAYPEYQRVSVDANGVYRVPSASIAKRHRMSIGTITSDSAMTVTYVGGAKLGTVEESFIARLQPGDCFLFGGRLLELVRIREMTALVKKVRVNRPAVPRWQGGRMPLSSELAGAVLDLMDEVRDGTDREPETRFLRPLLALQTRWSALPGREVLLVETLRTREGHHAFFFPFAGRQVHSGLSALFAWRVARHTPATFSMSFNDYGFELLSAEAVDWQAEFDAGLLSTRDLTDHIGASLNAGQLARRKFREIARVAGLVFQGFPGQMKMARQLQASSELLFDVFERYDPNNRLLRQARGEALAQELELARLEQSLQTMLERRLDLRAVQHPTPFAFPLMVERFRERLSTEKLSDRVARMVSALEKAAEKEVPPSDASASRKSRKATRKQAGRDCG